MVRILVVDDEESICETLTWLLEKGGHKVTTAMTLTNAKEIIKTEEFEIYFIDLVLPGGNGIELIKLIRDLKKQGVVIIITGYPNIPTLVDSIRLDTYDYIKKPINKENLEKIVNQALSR
ncbi:MAG: response regulator [Promethearchaeota archaeon]